MTRYATIPDVARGVIDDLIADGCMPNADEVVNMSALGHLGEEPEQRALTARGRPVSVGGVVLWPLTIAAGAWMEQIAKDYRNRRAVLAYAMAHGRDARLDEVQEHVVNKWYRSIKATPGEIDVALAEIILQDEQPEQPKSDDERHASAASLSAIMCATVGGTPEQWERMCSIGYCHDVLAVAVAQNAVDGRKNASDPRIQAQIAMYWAAEKVRRRCRGEVAERTEGGKDGEE